MGFNDLTSFNVAMLGKQGWKFQTENSSLATRLFKARYFPNNDFVGLKLGSNPSYVWRGILVQRWSLGKGRDGE